jgi:pentose-5-phosphate-3-epimerase
MDRRVFIARVELKRRGQVLSLELKAIGSRLLVFIDGSIKNETDPDIKCDLNVVIPGSILMKCQLSPPSVVS